MCWFGIICSVCSMKKANCDNWFHTLLLNQEYNNDSICSPCSVHHSSTVFADHPPTPPMLYLRLIVHVKTMLEALVAALPSCHVTAEWLSLMWSSWNAIPRSYNMAMSIYILQGCRKWEEISTQIVLSMHWICYPFDIGSLSLNVLSYYFQYTATLEQIVV